MKRSRGSLVAETLTLVAWLLGFAVLAQAEPPPDPQTTGLEIPVYDVYVTSERDLVQKVTTVRQTSEEDIRWESARNLDEALVHQPSLVVRPGGQGGSRIDLRGLRTRQVLFLLDGVPFNSTEDGDFDSSLIPAQIIERVDVTYSNSSVLYGDGPLAGVVQIRTLSGEDGRYIGLSGIRDLRGTLRVGDILADSAVAAVETTHGQSLGPQSQIDTHDWVRPSLRGGRPVFVVRQDGGRWVPSERRSKNR